MSTLGERIKYARESKGYFQSDLAALIGVKSSGVISNWEKDLNKPDAEKIVKLCEVLSVSASFLLDYYGKSSFEVTPGEEKYIKKYRTLDEHGKEMVDIVLSKEYERVVSQKDNIVSLTAGIVHPEVNAAHELPNNNSETAAHDDSLMSEDGGW